MDRYVKYDAADDWAGTEGLHSGGSKTGIILPAYHMDLAAAFLIDGSADVPDCVGYIDIFTVCTAVYKCT